MLPTTVRYGHHMLAIIVAVLLAIGGIAAIANGSVIWGIILIVGACLIGPRGRFYSRRSP